MEEHGTTTPRNILVIANETVEGAVLHDAVIARAGDAEAVRVLVVTPALNSTSVTGNRAATICRCSLTFSPLDSTSARIFIGPAVCRR